MNLFGIRRQVLKENLFIFARLQAALHAMASAVEQFLFLITPSHFVLYLNLLPFCNTNPFCILKQKLLTTNYNSLLYLLVKMDYDIY